MPAEDSSRGPFVLPRLVLAERIGQALEKHVCATLALRNALAACGPAWLKKCLDELAFAADDHSGESLVPFAFGDMGFRVKPAR